MYARACFDIIILTDNKRGYDMARRVVAALIIALICINIFSAAGFAEPSPAPQLQSEAAILIDSKTGRVLFEKDADKRMYPASTTKIMSAILALESLNLSDTVTAGYEAVNSIPPGGSNIGILAGEQLTVEQLLYAMLLVSANEACNVIAEYMCGSVDEFVAKMNEKAQELGMADTHFVNPHGLHSPDHYSTARDLSILARYAMLNDKFRQIVATDRYVIDPTNKYDKERILVNTNYLISTFHNASYYYPRAIGIKTGYTSQAGNCLVSDAKSADMELIAVTLKAMPQTGTIYSFIDSKELFDYGFKNYRNQKIIRADDIVAEAKVKNALDHDYVVLVAKNDVQAVLPADVNLKDISKTVSLNENIGAPIAKGDVLGKAVYSYDGYDLGEVELVANTDIRRDIFMFVMNSIFEFFDMPAVKIPVILIIILFAVLYIRRKIRRRRRRKYLRSKRYNSHQIKRHMGRKL